MPRAVVVSLVLVLAATACAEGESTENPATDGPRVVNPISTTTGPQDGAGPPASPQGSSPGTRTAAPTSSSAPSATSGASPSTPSTSTSTSGPSTTSTTSTSSAPSTSTTSTTTTTAPSELSLALEVVADGFSQPVLAISPPGDPRLFVVDQPGRIYVIDGTDIHTFLDIRGDVRFRGEQGLLGLAFHPDYATNGLFYVDFIDNAGDTVLAEFSVSGDPNDAREGSRRDILEVAQPASNHNGGMIAFGPDGYLWFGLGDGGGSNDTYRNGQRADRRLGSMIRVDVGPGAPEPYGDPSPQPFVSEGGLPEVWSIGLRNPWRWAFDGDDLYVADVGQGRQEEINVVSAGLGGLNFGWPIYEGERCRISGRCDEVATAPGMPLLTYSHDVGCSITGGFVYRGSEIPELRGHYFFGDYCGGWIESVRVGGELGIRERMQWFEPGTVGGLTSFGIDSSGELYVLSRNGTVFQIVAA